MVITSKLGNMDLSAPEVIPVITAVQDDQYSRNIEVSLYENGKALELPGDTTAVVSYRKADGTGGNYDTLPDGTTACIISGNTVTAVLAPQVLTVPGPVALVVGLVSGEKKLHTFIVSLDVQPNPGLRATSENYYKVMGALSASGWEPGKYLGTDDNGNVVPVDAPEGGGGDVSVDDVLEALPTVSAIDFSNFENGSFAETADGNTVTHAITFDSEGRPVTIDGISITWGTVE